jgi:hypothetical protein
MCGHPKVYDPTFQMLVLKELLRKSGFKTGSNPQLNLPSAEPPRAVLSGASLHPLLIFKYKCGIIKGFKWTDLPQDAIIVDVGGGVGSTALILARAIPDVNIIVQDRVSLMDNAKMVTQSIK